MPGVGTKEANCEVEVVETTNESPVSVGFVSLGDNKVIDELDGTLLLVVTLVVENNCSEPITVVS